MEIIYMPQLLSTICGRSFIMSCTHLLVASSHACPIDATFESLKSEGVAAVKFVVVVFSAAVQSTGQKTPRSKRTRKKDF